jgi:AraC-like DNA-binding protein
MSKPLPIFKVHNEVYRADTCGPLVRAVDEGSVDIESLSHSHYPGRQIPAGILPRVSTVGYWDAGHDQDWGLPWHRNEGVEFTFLQSGSLGFAVDDHECTLQPGDLTVTRPWQRHRVGLPNVTAGRLHWLIFDVGVRRPNQEWNWPAWVLLTESDLAEFTNILRHNERPVWHVDSEIRKCFQAIGQAVKTDAGGSNGSRLAVRINELFVLLLDMLRQQKVALDESLSSSSRTVQLFLASLREHVEHLATPWSVHQMAESCGLGVTQFVHHAKVLTNMTPLQYLNTCRLDAAAKLLRERRAETIVDIAMACGFSSSQYFATVFNQRFGDSPRDYRRRLPAQKDLIAARA